MAVITLKFSQFQAANLSNTTNVLVGADSLSGSGHNIEIAWPLVWTNPTRPAMPAIGLQGYNSSLSQYEFWNGSAWVQFSSSPDAFIWNNVSGTSITMAGNNGYVANNSSLVTLSLPVLSSFGQIIRITGFGSGGWKVVENSGQTMIMGNTSTTASTGYLASTNRYDQIEILCVVANTTFIVLDSFGNITVV